MDILYILSAKDVSGRLPVKTTVTSPRATCARPSERAKYSATKSEGWTAAAAAVVESSVSSPAIAWGQRSRADACSRCQPHEAKL